MKKILTLLLAVLMLFSLAACSGGNTETESSSNTDSTQNTAEESTVPETDSPEETPETEGSRILVAYFSATGNTEGVA